MNIKSLILGSATAALAVSGAQAADAIVIAEPEPVEYVRVCDVYGAGYFYIPGTETCLRISGWVRHQIGTNTIGGTQVQTGVDAAGVLIQQTRTRQRDLGLNQTTGAQLNFDARSETEYGTLRGWVQLEGFASNRNHGGSSAVAIRDANGDITGYTVGTPKDIDIYINRALIQLGGLYMGYADSLFSSSSNIGGSGLGNYGGFTYADTFDYHYSQTHQIGYQFSGGNGFWGAIAIEHDGENPRLNRYTPDVVGKVAYQQAWGGAWLAAAYDNWADGVGVRGGIQANFSPLTVRLDGYYRSNANVQYGPSVNLTGPWRDGASPSEGTRWGVQATALYQINPKLGVAAGLGYYDDLVARGDLVYDLAGGFGNLVGITDTATNQFIGGHAWTAQLGLNWQPVQNFQIGADVIYRKAEVKIADINGNTAKGTADATAFRLRFQRNF